MYILFEDGGGCEKVYFFTHLNVDNYGRGVQDGLLFLYIHLIGKIIFGHPVVSIYHL